jgi:hypothetical protein
MALPLTIRTNCSSLSNKHVMTKRSSGTQNSMRPLNRRRMANQGLSAAIDLKSAIVGFWHIATCRKTCVLRHAR